MVLSLQISVIYIEPSYWVNLGCWLSSVLSYVKTCMDLVFPTVIRLKFEPRAKIGLCIIATLVPEQLVTIRIWTLDLNLQEGDLILALQAGILVIYDK